MNLCRDEDCEGEVLACKDGLCERHCEEAKRLEAAERLYRDAHGTNATYWAVPCDLSYELD